MARVTVGVPVFNGETLLEGALGNLAAQSFREIQVVVLDNASTDRTGEIAQRFVAGDARFSYRRQPYNKGCRQNFVDVLATADTPYFMWRAYDDLSSLNYVEELVRLLDSTPRAALAVGRLVQSKGSRTRIKTFPRQSALEPASIYAARLLRRTPPGWIYGLYRTSELRWSLQHVIANYAHVHAFDPLTILPFVVQGRVIGTEATDFVQGFVDRDNGTQRTGIIDPRMMETLRRDFRRYCRVALPQIVEANLLSGPMAVALWLYADRSYRRVKILNARVRMLLGEKPHAATTKYDAPGDATSVEM